MKVGVINVTGYSGIELARILARHPEAELAAVTGRAAVGKKLSDVFPHLWELDLPITAEVEASVDVVISALPHQASAERLAPYVESGVKAVDVSADYRLRDLADYGEWYGPHPRPDLLPQAVYGLPELWRDEIREAGLVANPGCYPTAAVLALAPAVAAGLIERDVVIDAKSGVSGAGRSADFWVNRAGRDEHVRAYKVGGHRHMPEIRQELRSLAGEGDFSVTFLPHLVPMTRGILASCYAAFRPDARLDGDAGRQRLLELYREFYAAHPFVHVVDEPPSTKHTLGSNDVRVHPTIDGATGRLIAIGCLDNLVKGAAGQAVQNMNLMFGLTESAGLESLALYP